MSTRQRAYIQIGFNKCGTRSLYGFFRRTGFASVHHDQGRLAITMDANLRQERHVPSGYERFEAFFDMSFLRPHVHVELYKPWERILEQVPQARFILNVRNVERWAARAMTRDYRVDNPSPSHRGGVLAARLPFAVRRPLPKRLKRSVKRIPSGDGW